MEAYLIVTGDYEYFVEEIYIGSRQGATERAAVLTRNRAEQHRQWRIQFDAEDHFRVDEVTVTEES